MVIKGNINQIAPHQVAKYISIYHPQSPSPPTSFRSHALYAKFSLLSQKTPSSFENKCKITAENDLKSKIG